MRIDIATRVVKLTGLVGHLQRLFDLYRAGELEFDPRSAKTFSLGLQGVSAEMQAIFKLFDQQLDEGTHELQNAADLLERHMGAAPSADEFPNGSPSAEEPDRRPVYVPDEFKTQGFLQDMAVPHGRNVVPFTGVRRSRRKREGSDD